MLGSKRDAKKGAGQRDAGGFEGKDGEKRARRRAMGRRVVRVGGRVLTESGADVTAQYQRGAAAALQLAQLYGCEAAILKANSPSCGRGTIYDGSFTHTKIPGDGLTAALLAANGIRIYNEYNFSELLHIV